MADLSDVSNMLVGQIAAYLYPNGTANPVSPVTGFPVKVFAGWPQPESLAKDLINNIGYISIYPTDTEKPLPLTTRDWELQSLAAPTITATVSGQVLTLGGTVSAGQNVAAIVNGKGYVVAAQASNTLAAIASALATLISVDVPATSSGTAVTVATARTLEGRVGTSGTLIRGLRRQQKMFQITAWANCDGPRNLLGSAIDQAIEPLSRAALPDGSMGILHYRQSRQDDSMQKQRIYRRDIFYAVDYMTTQTTAGTTVVASQTSLSGGADVKTST